MLRHLKEKLEQNRHLSYFKRHFVKSEKGRSIIEILGVLAVVAILSILFLVAYAYAMSKHQANQIYKQVDLRAVESFSNPALKNYETGEKYNLVGFKENQGGFNYAHEKGKGNRFYVIVKEVPGRACKRLQEMVREEFPIKREVFLCQGDKGISECTGSLTVTECSEGKRNTFVFAYDTSVSDLFPDPTTPNPDPIVPIDPPSECPEGSYAVGEQCCYPNDIDTQVCCENAYDGHEKGIWAEGTETCCAKNDKSTQVCCEANEGVWADEGTCCAKNDKSTQVCCELNEGVWADEGTCCAKDDTDTKACCEANEHHWVDKVTMVKTDDANGMCCINSSEYVFTSEDRMCCNLNQNLNQAVNNYCCPKDYETLSEESTIGKKIACCEANKHHWVDENGVETDGANGMCCEANGYHWVNEDGVETDDANGMCCELNGGVWYSSIETCCDPNNLNTQACCEANEGVWYSSIETCCDPNNLNTQACCEANNYHWVDRDTMKETSDANGMCCIEPYQWFNDFNVCCLQGYTPYDFGMCCRIGQKLVIFENSPLCCPIIMNRNSVTKECCEYTGSTWIPNGEGSSYGTCCHVVQKIKTDTGNEVTICCDQPNPDQRCSFDLDTDIPDNEEDCSALEGIWIGASNQCCTPSLIETNTNACCSKTGGKWSEKEGCTSITTQDGCIEAGGTWIPGENKCCSEEMIYYNTDSCCTKSGYYWDDESQVCSEEASGNYNCTVIVTIPTSLNYCISAINGGIGNLEKIEYTDLDGEKRTGYYPKCSSYGSMYFDSNDNPDAANNIACGKTENVPKYYPTTEEGSYEVCGGSENPCCFSGCKEAGTCSDDSYFAKQCVLWESPSLSSQVRASGEERAEVQLANGKYPEFCYLSKTLAEYFGASFPAGIDSSGLLYIGKWAGVAADLDYFSVGEYNPYEKITLEEDSDNKCSDGQVCSIASLAKGFIIESEGTENESTTRKLLGKCVNQTNNY